MTVIDSGIKNNKTYTELFVRAKIIGHRFIFRKQMTATRIGYEKELEKMRTVNNFGEAIYHFYQPKEQIN